MSRFGLALMTTLFLLAGSVIAGSVNSQGIYYYLYEYTDNDGNKVAIIFEINTDSTPQSPGSEFTEVTSNELEQKGYETPSETERTADDKDIHDLSGYGWSSYFKHGTTPTNYKWAICGSKTSRAWYNPGTLFVACTTYRWVHPVGPRRPVYIDQYQTWGYYTYLEYYQEYRNVTYGWLQKGRHHWGDPNGMRYSSAGGIW